jgi:hypothetical protein
MASLMPSNEERSQPLLPCWLHSLGSRSWQLMSGMQLHTGSFLLWHCSKSALLRSWRGCEVHTGRFLLGWGPPITHEVCQGAGIPLLSTLHTPHHAYAHALALALTVQTWVWCSVLRLAVPLS